MSEVKENLEILHKLVIKYHLHLFMGELWASLPKGQYRWNDMAGAVDFHVGDHPEFKEEAVKVLVKDEFE